MYFLQIIITFLDILFRLWYDPGRSENTPIRKYTRRKPYMRTSLIQRGLGLALALMLVAAPLTARAEDTDNQFTELRSTSAWKRPNTSTPARKSAPTSPSGWRTPC